MGVNYNDAEMFVQDYVSRATRFLGPINFFTKVFGRFHAFRHFRPLGSFLYIFFLYGYIMRLATSNDRLNKLIAASLL